MFNYDEIIKSLLNPGLTKQQLAKLIGLQSTQFTAERSKLKNNYTDEDLISAYTSFYFPTNALKLDFLVEQLSDETLKAISQTHILDIGTGPGTYAFASAELFKDAPSITGIDENDLMIKQANKLNEEVFNDSRIMFTNKLPAQDDRDRTLIFGNVINEMGMPYAFKMIKRYKPKFIICIEPGTSEVFKEMLALRKKSLLINYKIKFPCMGQGKCPLEGTPDWCHQSIKTSLDFELESLSQVAKLDRKVMPATIHFYELEGESEQLEADKQVARIIRLKKIVKHAFLWQVCTTENKVVILEVPKKLFKKKEIKDLEAISSGLGVSFSVDKELPDGSLRVNELTFL